MRYSLEQLEMFVAVADRGGFSAAARHLGKTQSTVSSAVANLELDLGVSLFARDNKRTALTPPGTSLLREAREILERCLALEGHAGSLGQGVEPELTIAIEIPHDVLMGPLTDFASQFPHLDLHARHPRQGDIRTLLLEGGAQLGILFAQPHYPAELDFTQMGRLTLTHVVSRDHPLAQLPTVRFADLHVHRRLAFSPHAHRLPTTEYLSATPCWQAESYPALLEMALAGLGWTTLPRQMIRRELARGDLVELALEAYPHTDWEVGVDLVWSKTAALGPAARWLKIRLLSRALGEEKA